MTSVGEPARLSEFLDLSVELTGFSAFDLLATGMAVTYLEVLLEEAGAQCVDDLLERFCHLRGWSRPGASRERALRDELLSVPRFGAVIRNLIKLWYLGQWYALPVDRDDQPSLQRRFYQGRHMRSSAAMTFFADLKSQRSLTTLSSSGPAPAAPSSPSPSVTGAGAF